MNFLKIVFNPSPLQQIIDKGLIFNPNAPPRQLISQLEKNKEQQLLVKYMQKCLQKSKELRLVGLLAILLIHSNIAQTLIEDYLEVDAVKEDNLLQNNIVVPFKQVIKKCSQTRQHFLLIKSKGVRVNSFIAELPYLLKMISSLCKIGKQIPRLGRYFMIYNLDVRSVQFFGESFMLLLKLFYDCLISSLQQYLLSLRKTKQQDQFQKKDVFQQNKYAEIREILKWLIKQEMPVIYEQIEVINYNKYFNFQVQGLIIKLFKLEDQSSSMINFIRTFILQEGNGSSQEGQQSILEKSIFPQDGSFMEQIFYKQLIKNTSNCSTEGSNKSSPTFIQKDEYKIINSEQHNDLVLLK